MANMQEMHSQARGNARFVENLGNKAVNEINRQYGEAVDEMFDRLHKQADGRTQECSVEELKEHLKEIGGGYTRVGFDSRADRDRFITDMSENGIEATYATEKIGGQWLVEIPNFVKVDKLEGKLKEEATESGKTDSDRVSARAILQNFTERTYVMTNTPTPVEVREEADVGKLQTNAHSYFTQHLDELGKVINKSVTLSRQLEEYSQSNRTIFTEGSISAGRSKPVVVLNHDTVIVGGQVVTDAAFKDKVLKQHKKRMEKTQKRVKTGDFIVSKTERLNKILADKAKNEGGGKKARSFKPPVSRVYSNKKKIQEAAYGMDGMGSAFTQKYAHMGTVTVAEAFKDLKIEDTSALVLDKYFIFDSNGLEGFSTKQIDALISLSNTGRANNLSLSQRDDLVQKLREKASEIRFSEGKDSKDLEALNKVIDEVKLSESEKLQEKHTDENGSITKDLIKIDYGLAQIEAVADSLNTDWQIANIQKSFNASDFHATLGNEYTASLYTDIIRGGGKLRSGGRLELSDEQFKTLNKVLKELKDGKKTITLSVKEQVHLDETLTKYEKFKGKDLSDGDRRIIENTRNVIKLSREESTSAKSIIAIEKDLGIIATSANFTPEKIMEMNKALIKKSNAAGLDIFERKNGKWVISSTKLETIRSSPELMKKIGMSKESLDVAIKVNQAQITNPDMLGLGNKIISLVTKADESGSISEFYGAVNKVWTGVKYTKSGVVAIRNNVSALKKKADIRKAKRSNYGEGKNIPKKRKPKTKPKKDKAEQLLYNANPEKLKKMSAKTEKAQEKALKKAAKKEKSLIGKYQKAKAKAMQKFANSALGKALVGVKKLVSKVLIKPAIIVGGVYFLIEAALILIVIVIMTISAFLENINPINIINNALAPETYADTVAYTLYDDYLNVKEKDWLEDDLQGFSKMYKERVDMRYGSDYEDFQTYMSRFDDVVLKDEDGNGYSSNIWINPFAASGVSHDGIIHEGYSGDRNTGKYDGSRTVTIGANNNAFGKIADDSDLTTKTSYSTIESGHTCNIKDILCMTDVMYNMETNDVGLDNEKAYNLMGASPEQVSFDDAVDNVAGFFKWLWNTIKSANPFGSTEYEPLKNFCNDKVGMKTIIKYAETLYESSHQQEVALSIEYHNTDPLIVQTSSGAKDISYTTSQTDASILGYCVSPVTTDFYLKWNGSRVSPYFTQNEDGTGTQYIVDLPTSQSGYKVQIDMSDMADGETACLKSDMGSNEATYNYIKGLTNTWNACWEQAKNAEVQTPVTKASCVSPQGGTGYYTRNGDVFTWHEGSNGWYDTEAAAKAAVETKLRDIYDSTSVPATTYWLAGDRNKFTRTFFEKPAFSVEYNDTTTTQRITGWHEEEYQVYWYWSSANGNGITTVDKGYGADWCVRKWDSEFSPAEENGQPVWHATGFRSEAEAQQWVNDYEGEEIWYTIEVKWENRTKIVSETSTFYRSTGSCTTLERKVDEFVRDCEGHGFEYCGGHVGIHSHGVVYSFSNEQIAMMEVLDETNGNPLADGFDLGANGYDSIRGKIIREDVDYSTAQTASSSGGSKSPLFDPQGSASGMYGLNLKVESGEWASGYGTRSTTSYHLMRDIFDIDTNVLKGDNIFPLKCDYKNYEGWNEDNMTLALLKWTTDWYDIYGFDIPQEIWYGDLGSVNDDGTVTPYEYGYDGVGQSGLSVEDIDNIVSELSLAYGSSFTAEREDAVRFALGYVGKGHYNGNHTHNFLSEACQGLSVTLRDDSGNTATISYDGSCTAGDEDDFTNYIRSHFGKSALTNTGSYNVPYTYDSTTKTSNALPADTIAHMSTDMLSIPIPNGELSNVASNADTFKRLSEISKFRTVMFIGITKNDIQLSTGQVIEAGVPITVDLTAFTTDKIEGVGNIYLHGRIGNGDFGAVSFDCYEWLYNDISKTRIARFN